MKTAIQVLALSALLSVFAPPTQQPPGIHGEGAPTTTETGAECFTANCTGKATTALCYACCNTNCTDAVGCQDKCDGLAASDALIARRDDSPALIAWLQGPRFTGPTCSDLTARETEWVATVSDDTGVIRWAVAVAGDRLMRATMSRQAGYVLHECIRESLTDGRDWRIRATAVKVAGEVGPRSFIVDIIAVALNDPVALVRERAAELVRIAVKN